MTKLWFTIFSVTYEVNCDTMKVYDVFNKKWDKPILGLIPPSPEEQACANRMEYSKSYEDF